MHISTIPKSPPKIIRENTYTDSKREKKSQFLLRKRAECEVFLRKELKFFEVKHVGTFNASAARRRILRRAKRKRRPEVARSRVNDNYATA